MKSATVPPERDAVIEAEGLAKSYRGRPAVDSLSFRVPEGATFGFLGPNGAGKSTTLKLLLGLTRPDGGWARVAGYDVWSQSKQVHRVCGVGFEISNLYERLTAWENLAFFARLAGRGRSDVEWALEAVGLTARAQSMAQELSRGMRQRLILARAILHRPRILFLDEPTAGLDPNAAEDIRGLIREFRHQGTTVFLTTHDMREAEELCEEVGILYQGRLAAMDTVAALKDRFGSPTVRLTPVGTAADGIGEYPLADTVWTDQARRWQVEGRRFWVHTQEATLDQVFRALTGRDLGRRLEPTAPGEKGRRA